MPTPDNNSEPHRTMALSARGSMKPVSGPANTDASGSGSSSRPASSGDSSRTSCMCWLSASSMPISAAEATMAAATALENGSSRNRAKSISGLACRFWRRTKVSMKMAPTAKASAASAYDGCGLPSSLMAYTPPSRPIMICSEPARSHGLSRLPARFGRMTAASTRVSSTMGTLIRNTEPHQ
ncbi:hypothetical protein D3C81_762890 [compost metagenome]